MPQDVKAPVKRSAKASGQAPTSAAAGSSGRGAVAVDAQAIALVAYELYERRGCVSGHDREDWLEAERIVRARATQTRR